MVSLNWDSAPRFVYGPNFISDLIGESSIFSCASVVLASIRKYYWYELAFGHEFFHQFLGPVCLKLLDFGHTGYRQQYRVFRVE